MGVVKWVLQKLFSILPDSPIQKFVNLTALGDVMGYINYFIPFKRMSIVLEVWIAAVVVFYGYKLIMKWSKII